MNFADKVKEIYEGNTEEDVYGTLKPDPAEFTVEVDPEAMKRVVPPLPSKELTPIDVAKAGIAIIDSACENVPSLKNNKAAADDFIVLFAKYLETVISILFGCEVRIVPKEKNEEEEDE